MIASLGGWLFEAYRDPRASARRVLGVDPSRSDGLLMMATGVVLGLLAAKFAEILVGRSRVDILSDAMVNAGREAPALAPLTTADKVEIVVYGGLQSFAFFLAAAALAYGLGRRAGGRATFDQILALSGWWAILWAPAQFVTMAAMLALMPSPETAGIALGVAVGVEISMIYLFAALVAQAHGFVSTGKVLAASLGLLLGAAVLIGLFALGGAAPGG